MRYIKILILSSLMCLSACSSQDKAEVEFSEINDLPYRTLQIKQESTKSQEKPAITATKVDDIPASMLGRHARHIKADGTDFVVKFKPAKLNDSMATTSPKAIDPKLFAKPSGRQYNVALLFPMSGEAGEIGNELFDAAQLALFDLKDPNIHIKSYDTVGTERGAVDAINEAINDKADIVLGPLFSHSTKAIKSIAKKHNIKIISFSNDRSLANSNVVIFGITPEQQIKRVVQYALDKGVYRYSALLPQNDYGLQIKNIINFELDKLDILPKNIQWYSGANEELSQNIRNLARLPEMVTEDYLKPKSEVLFIPESGNLLSPIISRLSSKNENTDRFRFVGVSDWENPSIYSDQKLNDSWFASIDIKARDDFNKVFDIYYGYKPSNLASLSYDAMALISLITADKPQVIYFKYSDVFEGIAGKFFFDQNGILQRELNMYQINNGVINKID